MDEVGSVEGVMGPCVGEFLICVIKKHPSSTPGCDVSYSFQFLFGQQYTCKCITSENEGHPYLGGGLIGKFPPSTQNTSLQMGFVLRWSIVCDVLIRQTVHRRICCVGLVLRLRLAWLLDVMCLLRVVRARESRRLGERRVVSRVLRQLRCCES